MRMKNNVLPFREGPSHSCATPMTHRTLLLCLAISTAFLPLGCTKRHSEQGAQAVPNPNAVAALAELRKLESVTNAGISLEEYSRRVLDAKIATDAHLATLRKTGYNTDEIAFVLQGYVVAKNVWEKWSRNEGKKGFKSEFFPPKEWENATQYGASPADFIRKANDGIYGGMAEVHDVKAQIKQIWSAMSDKLNEIEPAIESGK